MGTSDRVPADPQIFHITHVDNLAGILREGGLWCDAQRIARGIGNTNIGYRHIKERRLNRAVPVSAGGRLGDYVPFNFCPRSVMLYPIYCGHSDYAGGQEKVIHLVSSVSRALALGKPWAFTERHAELAHALYYEKQEDLSKVPWEVMPLWRWRHWKEERQAEFLVHEFFAWTAVAEVAVMTQAIADRVLETLKPAAHQPVVRVRRDWYY